MKSLVIGLEYKLSRDPRLLRRRLEGAGPAYIKLGQFVANRPDVFGKDLSSELASLKDQTRFFDVDPPPGLDEFGEPFAAASIAQVHSGVYKGRKVAVKIKKPGIDDALKQDLQGFSLFFRDQQKFMNDFRDSILKELDFKQELRNARAFARMYEFNSSVIVPKVYPEVSSDNVLVMDYVPSVPFTDATQLINLFLEQLLFEDLVHGDMHSGNIGAAGSQLVLYDFGNVIHTTKEYREAVRDFVWHVQSKDISRILGDLRRMGMYIQNEKATRAFLKNLFRYLETADLKEFRTTDLDVRVPVIMDPTSAAIVRSFSLLEGYCKSVDPGFSYEAIIQRNLEMIFSDVGFLFRNLQ
jgi:ubiquinone biosynthesis protein